MPDLGSGGEGSNPSRLIDLFYADIAQLVVQKICNFQVVDSSSTIGFIDLD
jgi:hypothetical protein